MKNAAITKKGPLKKFHKKLATAFASEKSLAKDWLSKEDGKAWKNLEKRKGITLTIHFKGLEKQILERLVSSGVAESKSEAIRMALFSFAYKMKIVDDKEIVDFLRKEASKSPRSPEEILSSLERAKNETIAIL